MKTLILSIINGLFTKEISKSSKPSNNSIFLKDTDAISGRTLIIEEGEHHVWVYLLTVDKKEIDFEGFLCTVVSPVKSLMPEDNLPKKEQPLPLKFVNKYSWIKNLKKEHIKVDWQENQVRISIKGKPYLIMDMNAKISYSVGLSSDCVYGKKMRKDSI